MENLLYASYFCCFTNEEIKALKDYIISQGDIAG